MKTREIKNPRGPVEAAREQMNVVIVGHVDHGKSTLIGRLLADTGALPEGKLEAVRASCARNAKPFEYAFLLDALKDEQSQGITIDSARCFFKSQKRDYIIIDAPGHIEFLKNMVSGAARAEAALLVIDANEGIQENSKRHGYMLSFLGIENITVCVNKMDLVGYSRDVFDAIRREYRAFLDEINITPRGFIPVSAREGDNMVGPSANMPWYREGFILEAFDGFLKSAPPYAQDLRLPIQDIYKFTEQGDDRRIIAGRVETGTLRTGDQVIFFPSRKTSTVRTIEGFHVSPRTETVAGESTGVTLGTQIYLRPGEILCRADQAHPHVSTKFRANIFWMGKEPFVMGRTYKLKVASQQVPVVLREILGVLDASELSSVKNRSMIDRYDVAECVLETLKPVAFDEVTNISATGRFVVVDHYEICGGGIILAPVFEERSMLGDHVRQRERMWERSEITSDARVQRCGHQSALVLLTGAAHTGKQKIAKALEQRLFGEGRLVYFLGISNVLQAGTSDSGDTTMDKLHSLRQLGEIAHLFTDAGLILIASVSDIDEHELKILKALNRPSRTVVVSVGPAGFPAAPEDLVLPGDEPTEQVVERIRAALKPVLSPGPEYII